MDQRKTDIELLFEVSWEVCNKIGGIYAVLSSKAKTLKEAYKDNLIFIGPDVWSVENPSPYFTEVPSLMRAWQRKASLPAGISVRVGRWDVPGKPVAVLVKFDGMYSDRDQAYGRMWDLFGVDSLHAYGDYDEGCAFGRAAAEVIKSILTYQKKTDGRGVVAHFDEWTTAMGLLTVKADLPGVATVFTTHATSIGRSICGNGKPLYDYLPGYNGDQMARELNMEAKHSLEKAAAHNADVFTTVSGVTADEAEQLLERRPEITPNGFELNFVPAGAKYTAARKAARKAFLDAATALTGKTYPEDTFIVATSGRCEYRNKGLDMYIDALGALRGTTAGRKVLAFVLVPAWQAGPREDLVEAIAQGLDSGLQDPVITHRLHNYNEDPVNGHIHRRGFGYDPDLDLIYVPCYLDGADGIFNLSYYDLLPGLDASVFCSYYEPWGYTPLESVAFGVPTVTTTLAGFGRWVQEDVDSTPSFASCGVEVIERTDSNFDTATAQITTALQAIIAASPKEITTMRKAAMDTAAKAQWTDFMHYYYVAYEHALKNHR